MDEIINFHLEHKYFVDVSKIKDGCSVKFPKNLIVIPNIQEYSIDYKIVSDGLMIVSNEFTKHFAMDNSVKRASIVVDIVLKTLQRNISGNLILVFDGIVQKKKISEILNPPVEKGDVLKDKKLLKNCLDILTNGADYYEMNKIGIGDQYNYLVNLINNGGLI